MSEYKPLVVYHAHCLDGICSAYIAHTYFKSVGVTPEFLPLDYSQRESIFNHDLKDRQVYVLDFSFTPKQTLSILDEAANLIWLDHHKSAIEDWESLPLADEEVENLVDAVIVLDITRSGAGLTWDYFYPHRALPAIVAAIEDRDLWRFKYAGTKEICAYMYSLPQDVGYDELWERWDEAFAEHEENPLSTVSYGALLLREQRESLKKALAATAMCCTLMGRKGRCANLPPQFASEGGHALALESETFGATWFVQKDGTVKWSLRSIGDYDVSEIAKAWHGGGHKNAAGFTLSLRSHYHILNQMFGALG